MTITRMLVLAAISRRRLRAVVERLPLEPSRGHPWSRSRRHRVLIACAALRTNLTMRELAATFDVSKSTAHRIVSTMIPRLAALSAITHLRDRRVSWVIDGTLIPPRDHFLAARSKNRWSCNAQILIQQRDLRIVRDVRGRSWQSQRSNPLPRIGDRGPLQAAWPRPRRRRLPWRPRARNADVSRSSHPPQSSLAPTSPTPSAGRARHCSAEELASSP
jgi:hypothetical protein